MVNYRGITRRLIRGVDNLITDKSLTANMAKKMIAEIVKDVATFKIAQNDADYIGGMIERLKVRVDVYLGIVPEEKEKVTRVSKFEENRAFTFRCHFGSLNEADSADFLISLTPCSSQYFADHVRSTDLHRASIKTPKRELLGEKAGHTFYVAMIGDTECIMVVCGNKKAIFERCETDE